MDFLGMMTAGTYTFAAVNAELTGDPGLTVSNADCLGRTALDTRSEEHTSELQSLV